MVNYKEIETDRVFHALSDRTRRGLLNDISRQAATVQELSKPYSISAPAISKHLKVLENAKLITRMKKGKHHRFMLNEQPIKDAREILNQLTAHWMKRIDNLEQFLESNKSK